MRSQRERGVEKIAGEPAHSPSLVLIGQSRYLFENQVFVDGSLLFDHAKRIKHFKIRFGAGHALEAIRDHPIIVNCV